MYEIIYLRKLHNHFLTKPPKIKFYTIMYIHISNISNAMENQYTKMLVIRMIKYGSNCYMCMYVGIAIKYYS
jgi:hypothetical protein